MSVLLADTVPKRETLTHLIYLHRHPALPKPSHMHKTVKNVIALQSDNIIKLWHIFI